jgi:hypothetical protein
MRQGLEGLRGNEPLRVVGHRDLHLGTGIAQPAHQFHGLVGGDPAADAEQDAVRIGG